MEELKTDKQVVEEEEHLGLKEIVIVAVASMVISWLIIMALGVRILPSPKPFKIKPDLDKILVEGSVPESATTLTIELETDK